MEVSFEMLKCKCKFELRAITYEIRHIRVSNEQKKKEKKQKEH